MLDDLKSNADMMLRRYDFLSAGLGALAVTTFCVARGQDPATAMWITGASTVVALVSTHGGTHGGNDGGSGRAMHCEQQ